MRVNLIGFTLMGGSVYGERPVQVLFKKKLNTKCKIRKGVDHGTRRLMFIDEKTNFALYVNMLANNL